MTTQKTCSNSVAESSLASEPDTTSSLGVIPEDARAFMKSVGFVEVAENYFRFGRKEMRLVPVVVTVYACDTPEPVHGERINIQRWQIVDLDTSRIDEFPYADYDFVAYLIFRSAVRRNCNDGVLEIFVELDFKNKKIKHTTTFTQSLRADKQLDLLVAEWAISRNKDEMNIMFDRAEDLL